jgi:hypothetical protein
MRFVEGLDMQPGQRRDIRIERLTKVKCHRRVFVEVAAERPASAAAAHHRAGHRRLHACGCSAAV